MLPRGLDAPLILVRSHILLRTSSLWLDPVIPSSNHSSNPVQRLETAENSSNMDLSYEVYWDLEPTEDPESSDGTAFPEAMQSSP